VTHTQEAGFLKPYTPIRVCVKGEGCVYPDSRCCSVILINQAAESIDAHDCTVTPIPVGSRLRRLERQSTVRSFLVVVPQVLSEDPPQVALPADH
jgi:hypothetical protein